MSQECSRRRLGPQNSGAQRIGAKTVCLGQGNFSVAKTSFWTDRDGDALRRCRWARPGFWRAEVGQEPKVKIGILGH